MLDSDLADLYAVETKTLNRAVKRNIERFPEDFMFPLTREEYNSLRYQFGTLKKGQHAKYLPRVFTEQGVAMLSSVLRSERAIQVNIAIMRAFMKLRELLATNKDLAQKLAGLERKYAKHDVAIKSVFKVIYKLMEPKDPPKEQKIGFKP